VKEVKPTSSETESIASRMEGVRCDLDEDVQEIVESARDMRDWRTYVRKYPWVCLGAALAVGYLVAPRRTAVTKLDGMAGPDLAKLEQLLAVSQAAPKATISGRLLAFVGDLAMQGISSYVARQTSNFIANQTAKSEQDGQP